MTGGDKGSVGHMASGSSGLAGGFHESPSVKLARSKKAVAIEEKNQALLNLKELIEKKKQIVRSLQDLETQIYHLETSYLEDTQQMGNVLRGWDGYFSSRGSGALKVPKKARYKEKDRLFTLSSATGLQQAVNAANVYGDDIEPVASVPNTHGQNSSHMLSYNPSLYQYSYPPSYAESSDRDRDRNKGVKRKRNK